MSDRSPGALTLPGALTFLRNRSQATALDRFSLVVCDRFRERLHAGLPRTVVREERRRRQLPARRAREGPNRLLVWPMLPSGSSAAIPSLGCPVPC